MVTPKPIQASAGRWTFENDPALREFFSIDETCLGRPKEANENKNRCTRQLGPKKHDEVLRALGLVIAAGFPSREAHAGLTSMAENSLCGVKHTPVIEGYGKNRTTAKQCEYLYKEWHRLLWTAYLGAHGVFWVSVAEQIPSLADERAWEVQCQKLLNPSQGLFLSPISDSSHRETATQQPSEPARVSEEQFEFNSQRQRFRAKLPRRAATFQIPTEHLLSVGSRLKRAFTLSLRSSASNRPPFKRQDDASRMPTLAHLAPEPTPVPTEAALSENGGVDGASRIDHPNMVKDTLVTPEKRRHTTRDFLAPVEEPHSGELVSVSPFSIASSAASDPFSPTGRDVQSTPPTDYKPQSSGQLFVPRDAPASKQRQSSSASPLGEKVVRRLFISQKEASIDTDSVGADSESVGTHEIGDEEDEGEDEDQGPAPSNGVGPGDLKSKFPTVLIEDWATDWNRKKRNEEHRKHFDLPLKNRFPPSRLKAFKSLLAKLETPILPDSQLTPHYIYGFASNDVPGYIKIGESKDPPERVNDWRKNCHAKFKQLWMAKMDIASPVFERIIHLNLEEHRRWDNRCTKKNENGGRQELVGYHTEWFEIDMEAALEVVTLWQRFSGSKPFDRGRLNSFWRNEVVEAYAQCENHEYPFLYWTRKMKKALDRWDAMTENAFMPEIKLSIRARSEGRDLAVEVFDVWESGGQRLVASVPFIFRPLGSQDGMVNVERPLPPCGKNHSHAPVHEDSCQKPEGANGDAL